MLIRAGSQTIQPSHPEAENKARRRIWGAPRCDGTRGQRMPRIFPCFKAFQVAAHRDACVPVVLGPDVPG